MGPARQRCEAGRRAEDGEGVDHVAGLDAVVLDSRVVLETNVAEVEPVSFQRAAPGTANLLNAVGPQRAGEPVCEEFLRPSVTEPGSFRAVSYECHGYGIWDI